MSHNQNFAPRLARKTAIVTGATGGIGLEIVRAFLREGATVIAADLGPRDSAGALAVLELGSAVEYRQLDISSEEQVGRFYGELADAATSIDILVNNAGIILGKPLRDTTLGEWDQLHAINGRGTFLMMRGVLPLISESGSVVSISSSAAVRPTMHLGAYSASKAVINALTKAAAMELAPIRFNVVCPGPIDTPMPRKFVERLDEAGRTRVFNELAGGRALKRLGLPAEIAAVVLFLASDEASYMTGMELNVDGGKL